MTTQSTVGDDGARRFRILLVDDSRTQRMILRTSIEAIAASVAVEEAEDGEAGLSMALNDRYDAILLDVNMPRLGGLEVLGRLKDAGAAAKVVLMSADADAAFAASAPAARADGVLSKPIKIAELAACLAGLLDDGAASAA